jgi:hypothetical protein
MLLKADPSGLVLVGVPVVLECPSPSVRHLDQLSRRLLELREALAWNVEHPNNSNALHLGSLLQMWLPTTRGPRRRSALVH